MWRFNKGDDSKYRAYIRKRIKDARDDKNWTQAELAEHFSKLIYKSQKNISDMETGRTEISAVDLMWFAITLEKPITYFFPDWKRLRGLKPGEMQDWEMELMHYARQIQDQKLEKLLIKNAKDYAKLSIETDEEIARTQAQDEEEE